MTPTPADIASMTQLFDLALKAGGLANLSAIQRLSMVYDVPLPAPVSTAPSSPEDNG